MIYYYIQYAYYRWFDIGLWTSRRKFLHLSQNLQQKFRFFFFAICERQKTQRVNEPDKTYSYKKLGKISIFLQTHNIKLEIISADIMLKMTTGAKYWLFLNSAVRRLCIRIMEWSYFRMKKMILTHCSGRVSVGRNEKW